MLAAAGAAEVVFLTTLKKNHGNLIRRSPTDVNQALTEITMTTLFTNIISSLRTLPDVFREPARPVSYDDQFKDRGDGCARYDDVWGG